MKTPGDTQQNLEVYEDSKSVDKLEYMEMLGSLMYLSTGSRPDITFVISNLSRFSKDPREIHLNALKRVFRYLKGTLDYSLKFPYESGKLHMSTDASWSVTRDGKSYSGYIVKIGKAIISWKSKIQPLVALSTWESELIALCDGICELTWVRNVITELGV